MNGRWAEAGRLLKYLHMKEHGMSESAKCWAVVPTCCKQPELYVREDDGTVYCRQCGAEYPKPEAITASPVDGVMSPYAALREALRYCSRARDSLLSEVAKQKDHAAAAERRLADAEANVGDNAALAARWIAEHDKQKERAEAAERKLELIESPPAPESQNEPAKRRDGKLSEGGD